MKITEIDVLRAFSRHFRELLAPEPRTAEAEQFLLVLSIREWQLKRFRKNDVLKLVHLPTLKTGIRRAEDILNELAEDEQTREVQQFASLVWSLAHEFAKEVAEIEAVFPHLAPEFDSERAAYRKMQREAEEAERIE